MKNILLFALAMFTLSVSAQQLSVVSQQDDAITLRISLEGFESQTVTTPRGEAITVTMAETTPLLREGAPEVPQLAVSFILPPGTSGKFRVENTSYTDYEGVLLAPSKGNLYRDVDPASVPYSFSALYDQDAFYPQSVAALRKPYTFRDYRGQTVLFYPVQYNPVQQAMRVYDEITATIAFEADENQPEAVRGASAPVPEPFHLLYGKRFINYNRFSRYEPVGELGNMLIITTEAFLPVIEPLVEWKNQRGIPTEVALMSEIGSTSEDVNNFVSQYYSEKGLTYLLIAGDENVVPTSLTATNNACDHCYAYQAGSDHYPEFFVGRFNAENEAQLQLMVDRNMIYERSPRMDNPGWFSTAIGIGSSEGPGDDDERDYEHLNNIKSGLLDYGYTEVYEFYQGNQGQYSPTPGSPTADAAGEPLAASINAAIETGSSLINYTGHGGHEGLSTGNYNTNAADQLTNTGAYPFMIAVACCVGDFQNDFGAGPCLGDAWVRAVDENTGLPAGGIGGCFSSILQSWSPPMEGQDEMNKLIAESGTYAIRHSIGSIVVHGGGSMIDAYGPGGDEMMDTWNIFGDPSVVLWTKRPDTLQASHATQVFLGTSQLVVECPVPGALVGLYHEGRNIAYALVDEDSTALMEFSALDFPSPVTVTVTAYNYLPYQGAVQVIPVAGPFVTIADYTIGDETGNDNQRIDYGETIQMGITLANVGLDTARALRTTLSTANDAVTLLSDTFEWGDLADSLQRTEAAPFQFVLADSIPDQLLLEFIVEAIDTSGHSWQRVLKIRADAPRLEVGGVSIDDSATGNGNGRLEPGETALLLVDNRNMGHSASPAAVASLASGSPYLSIESGPAQLVNISAQATASFIVHVAEDVPIATVAPLSYQLDAHPYGVQTAPALLLNLLVEDFENNGLDTSLWQEPAEHPWFFSTQEPYKGEYCLQSGDVEDNESSELSLALNVIEPGFISFNRRLSSEADWDYLFFYIDGEEMGSWSGESGWEVTSYDVAPGEHTFQWIYHKDDIISAGQDAAWIDEVILPPYEAPEDTTVVSSAPWLQAGGAALNVYPNPTSDRAVITYTLDKAQQAELYLANAQGVILRQLAPAGLRRKGVFQLSLSMDMLPAGRYVVVLRTEDELRPVQVLKQ